MSKYGVISDPYFPVFGLNTKKIWSRNDSVFGHFTQCIIMGIIMMEIMTVQRSSYNKNIVVIVMTVVSKRMMLMVMLVTSIML